MFSCQLSDVVNSVRRHLFPFDPRNPRHGLFFHFDVSLTGYCKDNRQYTRRNNIYVVLCGNTNVWLARTPSRNNPVMSEYINTCNHDSCWCSDGVDRPITDWYFGMARSINADTGKTIAPRDMETHAYVRRILPIEVQCRIDPRDNNNYLRLLEHYKPLERAGI
jgi:hypothetical protein